MSIFGRVENNREKEKSRDCAIYYVYMCVCIICASYTHVHDTYATHTIVPRDQYRDGGERGAASRRMITYWVKKRERKWHAAFLAGGRRDEGVLPRGVITGRRPSAEDRVNDLTGEQLGNLTDEWPIGRRALQDATAIYLRSPWRSTIAYLFIIIIHIPHTPSIEDTQATLQAITLCLLSCLTQ